MDIKQKRAALTGLAWQVMHGASIDLTKEIAEQRGAIAKGQQGASYRISMLAEQITAVARCTLLTVTTAVNAFEALEEQESDDQASQAYVRGLEELILKLEAKVTEPVTAPVEVLDAPEDATETDAVDASETGEADEAEETVEEVEVVSGVVVPLPMKGGEVN